MKSRRYEIQCDGSDRVFVVYAKGIAEALERFGCLGQHEHRVEQCALDNRVGYHDVRKAPDA